MKFTLPLLLISMLSVPAWADDASPCKVPVVPNREASDMVLKSFNKHMDVYKACIKKFVDDQRALSASERSTDPAKSNKDNEAAEAAIKEYNALIEELGKRNPEKEDE